MFVVNHTRLSKKDADWIRASIALFWAHQLLKESSERVYRRKTVDTNAAIAASVVQNQVYC